MANDEKLRGLRVPLFIKFLIGNLLLAALLITGGYYVVKNETRFKNRGNFMDKHWKRFVSYVEGLGRATASAAEVVAMDDELQAALAATRADAPPPMPGTPPPMSGAAIGEHLFKHLSGKNGLQPDLLMLFTTDGRLLWAPPDSGVTQDDLGEMAAVTVVRNGGSFFGKILVQGDQTWAAVGLPVRAANGGVIGGLILGTRLDRYMQQFKEQSDEDEVVQHRLVLVVGGKVVASAFDPKVWPELEKQVLEANQQTRTRGADVRKVIVLKSGEYDFAEDKVQGFAGMASGPIGDLYILRSRATLATQEQAMPWVETIIGIALSIVIALLLAAWVSRPIKQFVSQSRQLLQGETDLTHRVRIRSRDETADLAENINQVFGRLHDLAAGVQSAAFQVGASSAEISAASKQMLAGLKDQTMKIEGSTAAVTELSASIQQVAANAAQATDVAEKSNVAVGAAVSRMQQIRGAVDDAAEKMKELGESSKRIGNIVEVIRQISEQTSLLALNASIEAAHAGEQGRGFAVVADEVSSLARRVGQSAKDIEALIQTIKEQTAAAIASMDVGTREVEGGAQLVTNTLTDLGQLISVVKDTASAVQEQAVVSDEIARNMDAVQKIAGEVLSGSEESVVQAEQLHELAFQLEQSIGGFNLDSSSAAAAKRNGAPRRAALDAAKALPKRASEGRNADSG
ncbi:MAG TPA: HAMP domain-containing methyl-accepting chemotaxis protein [Kofleriaceae bacterium]|jgi:methyl-accepting chemotaxis protein|nr:HAMP domain-containing methyl-accepting chemotaxis protein [Kofleriaceae bacterium]